VSDTDRLHVRAGSTADGPWSLVVTPAQAGWGYSGLRVLALRPGGSHTWATGEEETLVLPLSGACRVVCDGVAYDLAGRSGVFDAVSDFVYVPRDAEVTVTSEGGGRFAVPSARCDRRLPPQYRAAADVSVELRGAGQSSRQVNNLASAASFDGADRLQVVEVLTPSSNWSSYPPHKHDEFREGEVALEEVYYFEVAPSPAGTPGVAYQRVYGTADRPVDVLAEVGTGDVVLVPHGWHGPSMAAPGYHLYYLNVMAGPGEERVWRICDDPAHAWVKEGWAHADVDPRLPLTAAPAEPRPVAGAGKGAR
jgi:5-deoxy-glucuronate isomerase